MTERRQTRRLQMQCGVLLWNPTDGTFTRTITEDLSCQGFSCQASDPYLAGEELQAILEIPSGSGNSRRQNMLTVQCQVEVVRIRNRPSGVGCRIKDYTVIAGSICGTEIST